MRQRYFPSRRGIFTREKVLDWPISPLPSCDWIPRGLSSLDDVSFGPDCCRQAHCDTEEWLVTHSRSRRDTQRLARSLLDAVVPSGRAPSGKLCTWRSFLCVWRLISVEGERTLHRPGSHSLCHCLGPGHHGQSHRLCPVQTLTRHPGQPPPLPTPPGSPLGFLQVYNSCLSPCLLTELPCFVNSDCWREAATCPWCGVPYLSHQCPPGAPSCFAGTAPNLCCNSERPALPATWYPLGGGGTRGRRRVVSPAQTFPGSSVFNHQGLPTLLTLNCPLSTFSLIR